MKKLFALLLQKKQWLHKQQGYGLMHVGIVLALMLIICSLSLPRFHFLQHRLLRIEAGKILLMFRYLERIARAHNQDQHFYFSPQEGWYEGAGQREYLPQGLRFGVLPNAYGPPSQPTHLLTAPSTYKDNKITFYAQGVLQSGTLYITDSEQCTMYAVSSSVSPFIEIKAYRYQVLDKQWIPV